MCPTLYRVLAFFPGALLGALFYRWEIEGERRAGTFPRATE